jgi:hypothetical protein
MLATAVAACPLPAAAQDAVRLEAAVVSDHRERGLSWSEGKVAAQALVEASPFPDFTLSADATTARGSRRHEGADASVALRASYGGDLGLVRLQGGATAHLFPGGRGTQDYVELDASAGTLIGPLDLSLSASYAPRQAAIGGDDLHGRASLRAAVPETRFTLRAQLGRSIGGSDDPLRARRLRPGGAYTDWLLGADYAAGRVVLSLAYSDTDSARIDAPQAGHYGSRIVAGAHFIF